jgi:hypothetical protein
MIEVMRAMVERRDRDQLALQLRRLAAGRITNDDFEISAPWHSADRGVTEILWSAWTLYSDIRTHRLVGRDALTVAQRRHIARAVVFLHSDAEYAWPRWPIPNVLRDVAALLTRGRVASSRTRRLAWEQTGELALWPFGEREQYDRARNSPRLMSGA